MRKLVLALAVMAGVFLLLNAGGSVLGQTVPTIASITPPSGPVGQTIAITGAGFTPASTVTFGGTTLAPAIFISPTVLCVAVPSGLGAGPAPVIVSTGAGTSGAFPFTVTTAPPGPVPTACSGGTPTATASASSGSLGGNVFFVDTTGSDLNSCNVSSNPTPALSPPTAIPTLTFAGPPTVTFAPPAVSPQGGPIAGGTKVTITGSGFVGNSQVFFGYTPATSVQVVNGQLIYAVSPPAPGPEVVSVVVQNPQSNGTGPAASAGQTVNANVPPFPTPIPAGTFAYGFDPTPVVAQLFPNAGPSAGGTVVTIRGENFEPNATVSFGGVPATNVTVVNGYELIATAPPGTGTVDVRVTNPAFDGSGPTTSPIAGGFDRYTYDGIPTTPATPTQPIVSTLPPQGPCGSIQGAVNLTRDRDGILVNPGTYVVNTPIEVNDLIAIAGLGFGQTCPTQTFALPKIILRSGNGQPIFHVTAPGSQTLHPFIAGFQIGGATSFTNPGAIQLDGSTYTELRCNIIGEEDLPNVIGVLLKNADYAYIHDNTIQGSSQFPISPTIGPSPPVGGFGIVTAECLGAASQTDNAIIDTNLIAFNSNAGILFCSDGSGGHRISNNFIRDNGRGIVLQDANNVLINNANIIEDNYYDGVEILGTSESNTLDSNRIDGQTGPQSSGVLLEGDGELFPLDNAITNNQIRRNTTNVFIAGARATHLSSNSITAVGENADFVFALGNPSGDAINSANPEFAQPSDTLIHGNTVLANGPCSANRGCAIRLMAGVTTSVDATTNDFGVTSNDEIRSEIWDKYHDPALGEVVTYQQANVPVTPTPPPTLVPQTPGPAASPPVAVSPFAIQPPTVGVPVATATPAATSAPAPAPAPAATAAPPASAAPVAYIDPATGNYYVQLTLCVSGANGQPVANDPLTIALFDAAGNALGSASATTNSQGCFLGAVAAPGQSAGIQPASITVTDPSGATSNLTVALGSPLYRSPS